MHQSKILIVDDRPQNLVTLEHVLRDVDAELVSATSGHEALELSLNHRFALAILDAQMPEMDGFDLAQLLRDQEETCRLPIIFLSAAYSEFTHVFRGYESGAVDYLVKPFDPGILREKVKVFLELDRYRNQLEGLVLQRTELLRKTNSDLSKQKVFLESVLESLTFPLVVIDPKTFQVEMSNSAAKHHADLLDGGSHVDNFCYSLLHGDGSFCNQGKNCALAMVAETGKAVSIEFQRKLGDGDPRFFELKGYPIFDEEQNKVSKIIESITDVTDRKNAEENQRIASEAIDNVMEGILVIDTEGRIEFANPAFLSSTGYTSHEVIGKNLSFLKSDKHDDVFYMQVWRAIKSNSMWKGEIWSRRKSGESYPQWLSVTGIRNRHGQVTHYVGASRDITLIKEAEEEIRYRAYHDPLTNLPNRLLFRDRLQHAIARASRVESKIAVLFIDLDHFKNFNDSLGHSYGDKLLQVVASKIELCVRDGDTVARIGGDEFTVIMEDIDKEEDVIVVANKLLNLFKENINIGGESAYLGVSIGISIYPNDGEDVETLTKLADTAMYCVKDEGRNNYRFFTPDMEERIVERVSLEQNLRAGIDQQQFLVHYQPVIDIKKGCVAGMEALVRWDKPDEGLVFPNRFIPLAEARGLIVPIGEWVLRQACTEATLWRRAGYEHVAVSVNLSARQFREKDLVERVKKIIDDTGIEPEQLILEITETTIMEDMENSVATMHELKAMNIRIAMDDFGTGYSSFNYLKEFPVDYLKLDYLFIRDITTDHNARKIAIAVIGLAKELGLTVVAEGVETAEQLNFLKEHGCDLVQGFYFSKPIEGEQLEHAILEKAIS